MGISITLEQYLNDQVIPYEPMAHEPTGTSLGSAEASHVSGDALAKAVVLRRREGYLLAIVPASTRVNLARVGSWLRQPVALATEDEAAAQFPDCAPGAIPPIGAAYGMQSLVDERLENQPDIYFEGGDHRTLVHVSGEAFHKLMEHVPHRRIAREGTADTDKFSYFGA